MGKYTVITIEEARAIINVGTGADILDIHGAAALRSIEKKTKTALITICRPKGRYSVSDRRPYFGCKATWLGIIVARSIIDVYRHSNTEVRHG
jgi:hypothetical protein